jgi:methylenetetrahydrofolate dehydrogenase (NADP+) / methenyltetrahydrofolate cyclohydrolase
MAATLMDGRAVAARVREEVAAGVRELGAVALATILVGDDPASDVYIGLKQRAATEAGIDARDIRLPAHTPEAEVLDLVGELNADPDVDGVLVQTPLSEGLDERRITGAVDPAKDVDGLTPVNAGRLALGEPGLVPATAAGVMRVLEEYEIPLEGARAVVIGRSAIVGKPVAQLLVHANATVTVCHTRTRDLARHTLDADVLVVAVGVPHLISADMVKRGAAVVDVGITRTEAGLIGDVDPGVAEVAGQLTPVPGGIGPMTIAMVLANTVAAARARRRRLASPRG